MLEADGSQVGEAMLARIHHHYLRRGGDRDRCSSGSQGLNILISPSATSLTLPLLPLHLGTLTPLRLGGSYQHPLSFTTTRLVLATGFLKFGSNYLYHYLEYLSHVLSTYHLAQLAM